MWNVDLIATDAVQRAANIQLMLSDNDGVLTDACVYYSESGETLKKYNMRDGMGFDRLREIAKIETGIVTREETEFARRRAEKLKLSEVLIGIKDKPLAIREIAKAKNLSLEQIGFIGDDMNDLEVLKIVGFAACPKDALPAILEVCHVVAHLPGGHGAFRCVAEFIIESKLAKNES
ncbi:MAG: HAD-IA family hydrolase [Leptospiraceae bacterium]|nr:HAD-IA family hydrolase [Leptospiraceae bacterium]